MINKKPWTRRIIPFIRFKCIIFTDFSQIKIFRLIPAIVKSAPWRFILKGFSARDNHFFCPKRKFKAKILMVITFRKSIPAAAQRRTPNPGCNDGIVFCIIYARFRIVRNIDINVIVLCRLIQNFKIRPGTYAFYSVFFITCIKAYRTLCQKCYFSRRNWSNIFIWNNPRSILRNVFSHTVWIKSLRRKCRIFTRRRFCLVYENSF